MFEEFLNRIDTFLIELLAAGNQGLWPALVYFFTNGGWVFFLMIVMVGGYQVWLMYQQEKYANTIKWTLLAIDIPRDTEQTPKAVEQLFATISGAHTPLSKREMYIEGKFQLAFQFELVSIDGYVQFLIRTPSHLRDIIESAVYSQYPDAEITEVEDYIDSVPRVYPNETHNYWGTEVILAADQALPIKTHIEFEDRTIGELKDPMAAVLETLSKIKKGEQVWLQIFVRPTGFEWTEKSKKLIDKLAGRKQESKPGFIGRLFKPIFDLFFLSGGDSMFLPTGAEGKTTRQDDQFSKSLMFSKTPGELDEIKAIEMKMSKVGFECKIRLMYISPLELYSPARVIGSVFGAIKQFNTHDLNAFKPDKKTKTSVIYFVKQRTKWRRNKLMRNYRLRSSAGYSPYILNIEELATIWHFPNKFLHTPLVQKTDAKKADAPATLPIASTTEEVERADFSSALRRQLRTGETPSEEQVDVDLDNDEYERRFAKKGAKPSTNIQIKGTPPSNLPTA